MRNVLYLSLQVQIDNVQMICHVCQKSQAAKKLHASQLRFKNVCAVYLLFFKNWKIFFVQSKQVF